MNIKTLSSYFCLQASYVRPRGYFMQYQIELPNSCRDLSSANAKEMSSN